MGTKKNKKGQGKGATKLVTLTKQEVARLPKPREGFTVYAEPLFKLYEDNLALLPIKGKTPATARAELEEYLALVQQESEMLAQLAPVQETRALRGAGVWTTMLDIYSGALNAGRNESQLLHAIEAFARFMKTGPRHKASAPVASPPVSATPTTQP